MKGKVLLVEDNESILFNTKLMLKMNGYTVITSSNGKEAIELLNNEKQLPHVIVSDIMMPEMDGYQFYQKVSEHPDWNIIPFIFMTAKSSQEDIRFGKKMGVDDYITKPFAEEDLLASIEGKILKFKKNEELKHKYELTLDNIDCIEGEEKIKQLEPPILMIMDWDDVIGPRLIKYLPEKKYKFDVEDVGVQLYNTSVSIYGSMTYEAGSEVTLLKIKNINKKSCIYFDAVRDETVRGRHRLFMIVLLADSITYLESLRIGELLKDLGDNYKLEHKIIELKPYYAKVEEILK